MGTEESEDRLALQVTVGCLSFLVPGLGHVGLYAQLDDDVPDEVRQAARGVAKRGAILFAVGVFTLCLGGLLNLYAAWDVVQRARELEELLARSRPTPEPKRVSSSAHPSEPEVEPEPAPKPDPEAEPEPMRPLAEIAPLYTQRFGDRPEFNRPLWTPRTEAGEGSPGASRFGGRPLLGAGEGWPHVDGAPLAFFAQVLLDEVPDAPFGRGLLQLFLRAGDVPFDNDPGVLARVVDPTAGELGAWPQGLHESHRLSARRVLGWDAAHEPPMPDELSHGNLSEMCSDEDSEWMEEELLEDEWLELNALVLDADKLGGWPRWVQQAGHFERCPVCGERMSRLVLQLGSHQNLATSWGDAGNAYLFQCPEHLEEFSWEVQGH